MVGVIIIPALEAEVSTTDIIVALCSFLVLVVGTLVTYIWRDLKKRSEESVSETECRERREAEQKQYDMLEKKVCEHEHGEDGGVIVPLRR